MRCTVYIFPKGHNCMLQATWNKETQNELTKQGHSLVCACVGL